MHGYKAWCGVDDDFDGATVHRHEMSCDECQRKKSLAFEYARAHITVIGTNLMGRGKFIKEVKGHCGISTMKAQKVVEIVYREKLKS